VVPLIFGTGDSPSVVLQRPALEHIKAAPTPPDETSMGIDVKGNLLHFKALPSQAAQAARIAYYQAVDGPGVFAPRGWHCQTWRGSIATA
jgi:hypothetical protein